MRRSLCAVAVALVLSAAGCRRGFTQQTVNVPADLKVKVVAVYPFAFRWQEPAYRSFELGQRACGVALSVIDQRALVFGPSEFKVYRPEDDNIYASTTLGALVPGLRVRPSEVVVLRPWAEKFIHSSSKMLLDSKGKTVGAERQEETKYVAHVEVLHATTHQHLLELTAEAVVDPFEEKDEDLPDPSPELTQLVEQLTKEAMEKLADALVPPGEAASLDGYEWLLTPQLAFDYEEPGRPAVQSMLLQMDALDRELFVQTRARFLNPGLTDAEAAKLVGLPGGLYVKAAPEGAPLHEGDVVVKVNDGPALPSSLERARLQEGADEVRVRRASGDYEELALP